MNRKMALVIAIVVLTGALLWVDSHASSSAAKLNDSSSAWPGSWRMGPTLNTTMLGCSAGDGFARFSGIYYPEQDRVYFLGGRCEDDFTSGQVFLFDLQDRAYYLRTEFMVTPVSNYQVVRINNDNRDHGPGLYVIGGRMSDGTHSSAVQVYYPNADLAQVLPTDPFPPDPPYTPGGVVAWNERIYVFGGFDGANLYPSTYVYDPLASAGSRWTGPTPDLPSGRTYVAAVVVDDLIYAIGGDTFDGINLIPITDTLVLDTSNPTGWHDDWMADLPVPIGDAVAVYVDENLLGGGIYVIGGVWPHPQRAVYRYDLATDTWDRLPDLAIPAPATGRRNHAAVYVPSTSTSFGPGIPGMWAFGGYEASPNLMTDTSEYFANSPWQQFLPLTLR